MQIRENKDGGILFMKFTKMHGCGNDYVYVDTLKETIENPSEIAKKISDRHFGIGSDGLILIKPCQEADFEMAMYNADGSEGKMCGNGVRCIAKYVYEHGLTNKTKISLLTKGGIKYLELHIKENKVEQITVDMGSPSIAAKEIPVITSKESIIHEPIQIDKEQYFITCISMGNPHAIVFVRDTKLIPIEQIGPKFESHSWFPERINTEFVTVIDRNTIDMRVWERGSGETLACGTGACASVYACILNDLTEDEVCVHLLGGDLMIRYDREKDTIFMTGSAEEVFQGEIIL